MLDGMRCLLLSLLFLTGLLQAADGIKIGLIGDSTVAQQSGWSPAFAGKFDKGVTVHNDAVNGATLQSLSKRLPKLLALEPDYVLIQFGHNDQKRYDTDVYSAKLADYIERVKAAGAKPIVLSSVVRRSFKDGKIVQGIAKTEKFTFRANLTAYAKAAEATAKKEAVPFIDLHHISMAHHNQIGPEESRTYDFKQGDKATAELILPELIKNIPELKPHLL